MQQNNNNQGQNIPNPYNPISDSNGQFPHMDNNQFGINQNFDTNINNSKIQLDNLLHENQYQNNNNSLNNPDQVVNQFNQNDQFGSYNPYQNTGSNIQNFEPQDNFDTGYNQNQSYTPVPDFNQAGMDQYKSSTPQFNQNDPYLMPSTNPQLDDLEEDIATVKPQADTKKILMFALIGLIVILLAASLALYFLSQGKSANPPAVSNLSSVKSTSSKSVISEENNINKPTANQISRTGNSESPASKSIVNEGATAPTNQWLTKNFTMQGAVDDSGECKMKAVCGVSADPDKDGLNNLDEYIYETNPIKNDTDGDGLSDKDELFIYYTDPKNADTNSNSYKDGEEIGNCYDPIISGQKLSKTNLNEISTNVNKSFVNGLSEITKATLKNKGATSGDTSKGYLTKCVINSPNTEKVTTKSTKPNTPNPGEESQEKFTNTIDVPPPTNKSNINPNVNQDTANIQGA